jgi:hypothetical protein
MSKSSPKPSDPAKAGIDWLGVEKTLVIQVAVLLAISVAVIEYLNWSSKVAQAEFSSTMELMMANPASPSKLPELRRGSQDQRVPGPRQIALQ